MARSGHSRGYVLKARIYTKTGDNGQTSLIGGTRVSKTEPRLDAYGTLDELNSVLGVIRANLGPKWGGHFESHLQTVQNNLFNMGSRLACEDAQILSSLPDLSADALSLLENDMDTWEAELPPLKQFILPGGTVASAYAHVARTVCRRGERQLVRLREQVPVADNHLVYLNRLSDWLFVLARKLNHLAGTADITWTKGN